MSALSAREATIMLDAWDRARALELEADRFDARAQAAFGTDATVLDDLNARDRVLG